MDLYNAGLPEESSRIHGENRPFWVILGPKIGEHHLVNNLQCIKIEYTELLPRVKDQSNVKGQTTYKVNLDRTFFSQLFKQRIQICNSHIDLLKCLKFSIKN